MIMVKCKSIHLNLVPIQSNPKKGKDCQFTALLREETVRESPKVIRKYPFLGLYSVQIGKWETAKIGKKSWIWEEPTPVAHQDWWLKIAKGFLFIMVTGIQFWLLLSWDSSVKWEMLPIKLGAYANLSITLKAKWGFSMLRIKRVSTLMVTLNEFDNFKYDDNIYFFWKTIINRVCSWALLLNLRTMLCSPKCIDKYWGTLNGCLWWSFRPELGY